MTDKNAMHALRADASDGHSAPSSSKPEIRHFSNQRLKAPNGMELSFVHVTPELAAWWLSSNNCNRRLRPSVSDAYARDMEAGNWQLTPLGVALLPDGSLGNAQHTLRAICKSGVSVWLLVAWNVPKQSVAVMDRGITRTLTDVGHFLEIDFESRRGSIAKICNDGIGGAIRRVSFHESWASYERHKEAVDFAYQLGPSKREPGVNTTMLGVIARAWYTSDRARLTRFVEIVKSGVTETSEDQAAIKFRDWARGTAGGGGIRGTNETYRRSQAALKHFLAGAPITKLYGMDGNVFPIPE